MNPTQPPHLNSLYVLVIFVLTILFPALSIWIESLTYPTRLMSLELVGKWFIFYGVGIRLFIAGVRQVVNPSFTSKEISDIEDRASYPIVRELGFAKCCFGLIGIISLFIPSWRIASAFGSGIYFGIAGLNHALKKPSGPNELIALISDIFIFLVLAIYTWKMI